MRLYELVFLARPDLSPAQVEALITESTQPILDQQGEVGKTEYCGLQTLAYPIKKYKQSHYVTANLKASAAAITEMERKMRLNDNILRLFTARVEEHEQGPSALLQNSRSSKGGYRSDHAGRDDEDDTRDTTSDEA